MGLSVITEDDQDTSAKPMFGSPCNNCGVCCMASLCQAAEWMGAEWTPAGGCPLQVKKDGKTTCGVIDMEKEAGAPQITPSFLGVGRGCDCLILGHAKDDELLPEEEATHRLRQAHGNLLTTQAAVDAGLAPETASQRDKALSVLKHFRRMGDYWRSKKP